MIKPSTHTTNTAAGIVSAPSGSVYRLVKRIGKGGCGEVFKARRDGDGRYVAVKRLTEVREAPRFVREGKVLSEHPHPNLVEFVEFFEADTVWGDRELFLVMELLPRMPEWTLSHRYQASKTGLDLLEALLLFGSYLEGLQHLHEQGIIHRDIKPSNLYAPAGSPGRGKLIDLGIARDTRGTQTTGFVPGTWEYMAPELFAEGGERGSVQSDLYSLGLCLYAALVGTAAFPRTSSSDEAALDDVVRRIQGEVTIDYGRGVLGTNRRLQEVVRKATAHDPAKRYTSARQMQEDLEAIAAETPETARGRERDDEATRPTLAATGWSPDSGAQPADAEVETCHLASPSEPVAAPAVRKRSWAPAAVLAGAALMIAAGVLFLQTKRFAVRSDAPAGPRVPGSPTLPTEMTGRPPEPGTAVVSEDESGGASADREREDQLAAAGGEVPPALHVPAMARTPAEEPPPPPDPEPWRMAPITGIPAASTMSRLTANLQDARAAVHAYPDEPGIREVVAELEAIARAVPAQASEAARKAVVDRDAATARDLARRWRALEEYALDLGLTASDFARRAADLDAAAAAALVLDQAVAQEASLPSRLADAASLDQAEQIAAWLDESVRRPLAPDYQDQLAPIRQRISSRLSALATAHLHAERDQARRILEHNKDASAQWDRLLDLQSRHPALMGLVSSVHGSVLDQVAAWREEREAYEARMADLEHRIGHPIGEPNLHEALESAALDLSQWRETDSQIISSVEHLQRLSALRPRLREQIAVAIDDIHDAALRTDEEPAIEQSRDELVAFLHLAPTAAALQLDRYQEALNSINAHLEQARPSPVDALIAEVSQALRTGDWPDAPLTVPSVDDAGMHALRSEADHIRSGFRHGDLVISRQPALQFMASVNTAWTAARAFPAEARAPLYDALWALAHEQLTREFRGSLTGRTAARSPVQQARIRHEMLALLLRIEAITGRVSGCSPTDPLRQAVVKYFEPPFYHAAMLADARGVPLDLRSVEWLAAAARSQLAD